MLKRFVRASQVCSGARAPEPGAQLRVIHERADPLRERGRVVGRHEPGVCAVVQQFAHGRKVTGDERQADGHGLEDFQG
jgi:hypothetical protein